MQCMLSSLFYNLGRRQEKKCSAQVALFLFPFLPLGQIQCRLITNRLLIIASLLPAACRFLRLSHVGAAIVVDKKVDRCHLYFATFFFPFPFHPQHNAYTYETWSSFSGNICIPAYEHLHWDHLYLPWCALLHTLSGHWVYLRLQWS